ncbi:hypothetical protein EJV47_22395 [Hymenobacter gummosus]|uniref:GLPGLI family protein n=1 Tax=Hymenobacter gummosus TaxID=1776032 RepID=A0A3S0JE02_9BACT|nr:hypothetical protein [Hymenobacter gummosus]RTQ46279.1 hypothetical protein EJV47_22395 [Hymenobacter gummosus]
MPLLLMRYGLIMGAAALLSLPTAGPAPAPPTLLERLPLLPLPLRLDSTLRVSPVPFTRREAWRELLLPLNDVKEDSADTFDFPVGATSIGDYQQWKGRKLDQPLRRMPYYSPIFNGHLFVIGKVKLQGGLLAVLWGFHQNVPTYGSGPTYWLVVPRRPPGKAAYRTVYENLVVDMPDAPFIYTSAELRADRLTVTRKSIENPWAKQRHRPAPGAKDSLLSRQTYAVGAGGFKLLPAAKTPD